jgi:hypothetical protein
MAGAARTAPVPPEVAAQASFDTGALLAIYMAQLAAAGTPPSQADVDEAARLYFTNGATVNGVPTTGPGAAYFQNGAAVMAVPSSGPAAAYFHDGAGVLAYRSAPAFTPATELTGEADAATVSTAPYSEDAGASSPVSSKEEPRAPAGTAAGPPIESPVTGPSTATGPTCSPQEIEAAMAIARQFAIASVAPTTAPPCAPAAVSAPTPWPREPAGPCASEPAPRCPSPPPLLPRVAAASLGGFFFGGFAVALRLRSRSRRRRTARSR